MAFNRKVSVSQRDVAIEGSLRRWTGYMSRWRTTYLALRNGVLLEGKDKQQTSPIAHLDICSIYPDPKNRKSFVVEWPAQKLYFLADSEQTCTTWLETLSIATQLTHISPKEGDSESSKSGDPLVFSYQLVRLMCKDFSSTLQELEHERGLEAMRVQQVFDIAQRFQVSCMQRCCEACLSDVQTLMHTTEAPVPRQESLITVSDLQRADIFYDAESDSESVNLYQSNPAYRTTLPVKRNPQQRINIWKVIKDSIGKELSRITVPVYFNEPLSFLQRFAEDLNYSDILIRANACEDELYRLALVACFALSAYSNTLHRTLKPFNPLLGETFELETNGLRIVAEQVSHHPPVSAIYAEHEDFVFWAQAELKSAFRGTHVVITPVGTLHVLLKRTHEEFQWQKPQTAVHNIIVGKIYLDHYGLMEVLNKHTQARCRIVLKKCGWFGKNSRQVEGVVLDSNETPHFSISGDWAQSLFINNESTKETTIGWEVSPPLAEYEYYYYLPEFSMQLNISPEMYSKSLIRTDSRWRPDQRALENGDLKLAAEEKMRLEEKQRKVRKLKEDSGETHQATWFRCVDGEWRYNGEYWVRDMSRDVAPDIY